jgi:Tol biopolymer transport system component/tRNA A-37 threonylcarbamoyl transferase component Bud32
LNEVPPRLTTALADRYRLERELGQGGMATVYLAHDVRHDRRVALKVLRPELAAVIGAERFLQEIKTTAHLQHPHILALFDSGQVDGTVFYVMPFVEGESLRDRLAREKQLPIEAALRIAREVASALDYAHRHGVIHRDIKPENILLHDGQALVADFGIALAASSAGGSRMTETGMSLGTPHYMSPEQAMGERTLDARTDVYALGCVVYEMLTGEPPFTGPTAQAIVAKVMTDNPRPPRQLRRSVPESVEAAVLGALEKLPADRFAGTAEFAAALSDTSAGRYVGKSVRGNATDLPGYRLTDVRSVLLIAAIAAGSFFLGGRLLGGRKGPPLEFGASTPVTWDRGLEMEPALSPDGKSVAYAAGSSADTRIYIRAVSGGRPIRLTDDTVNAQTNPQWSLDGSRLLYLARGGVFSAPASGGAARQELPARPDSPVRWAGWGPDGGSLAYAIADSLFLRDRGGQSRRLGSFLGPALCAWSPDGSTIACASGNAQYTELGSNFGNLSPSRIVLCKLGSGALTTLTDSIAVNQSPIFSPDGRWLYFISTRDGPRDVYALRLSAAGRPSALSLRLTTGLNPQTISLSPDGKRLAYAVFLPKANVWSLPLPRPDSPPLSVDSATPVTLGNQLTESEEVSSDGKWLLYDSNLSGNSDVYRMPLPHGEPERLTTEPSDDFSPVLSPDGREVAFHSWRAGSRDIYVMPLDGGPLQRVTSSPRQEYLARWSPDGSALSFSENSPTGAIWVARRGKDGKWGEPVRRLSSGTFSDWSPDGRFLLVAQLGGGPLTVVPADSGPPRVLVEAHPGSPAAEQSLWSRDGTRIYFKAHEATGRASIWWIAATGAGAPHLVVRFDDLNRPSFRQNWSLGPDRIYFTIEERESDISVMEVKAR